jgi:hypothetical protein
LDVDWERFGDFTHHTCNVWNELVQYVSQTRQCRPRLSDPRLPADVRDRLNALLRQRVDGIRADQAGLVVDVARGAEEYAGRPLGTETCGPADGVVPPGPRTTGGLAETVLTWLQDAAADDVRGRGAVVAEDLRARLDPYDRLEANVLAGLNDDLNGMVRALGHGRPEAALTAAALSHVCGRTLRDWGDPPAGRPARREVRRPWATETCW